MVLMEMIFRCLRCGHEYEEKADPKDFPKELTCPKCMSNSVRRMIKEKAQAKKSN
jgi:putative FmdB family regulatory protein